VPDSKATRVSNRPDFDGGCQVKVVQNLLDLRLKLAGGGGLNSDGKIHSYHKVITGFELGENLGPETIPDLRRDVPRQP
jgi:hypothetical protein